LDTVLAAIWMTLASKMLISLYDSVLLDIFHLSEHSLHPTLFPIDKAQR